MSRVIYHIEDRGGQWIYHWMFLLVGGLRKLGTDEFRYGHDGCGKFEQNVDNYKKELVSKPFYVKWGGMVTPSFELGFQKECIDIISDQYIPVETIKDDDIVVNNYGEKITHLGNGANNFPVEMYEFVKKLFLDRVSLTDIHKNKKYYISRNKSHTLAGNKLDGANSGIKRRQILNDEELSEMLSKYGVETIFLEDYSVPEKIDLFKNSSLIISPNSGALVFSVFCDKTNIVELNVDSPHQLHNQYLEICNHLDIPYFKFNTEKVDSHDNMNVNVDQLFKFLQENNLI
tara:strand:- start:220 stop:1083 length:864 start_codon:yes stop_codon:yes gene_type:complete